MPETKTTPRYLRKQEAAEVLRISVRTLESLIARGKLPAVKIEKLVRVDMEDIHRYAESCKTGK